MFAHVGDGYGERKNRERHLACDGLFHFHVLFYSTVRSRGLRHDTTFSLVVLHILASKCEFVIFLVFVNGVIILKTFESGIRNGGASQSYATLRSAFRVDERFEPLFVSFVTSKKRGSEKAATTRCALPSLLAGY